MARFFLTAFIFLFNFGSTVELIQAYEVTDSEALLSEDNIPTADLFIEPAETYNLSKSLLMAVSEVESGFNPWAVNVEGQAFIYDAKEEALAKISEARIAGKSFDSGLMQVNSYWLDKYGISPEAALDPAANVHFGGWILNQEFRRLGDMNSAVGAYHSPSPKKAKKYVQAVLAALEKGPVPDNKPAKRNKVPELKIKPAVPRNHPEEALKAPILVIGPSAVLVSDMSMKAASSGTSMKVAVKHHLRSE
ncbi:MAG: lytic transglycosylase domain-containing protein [Deltaproteobacteria bacterium]|jgi:soluble lytic murein transglycosylase-like protein|nr:lytic transglycosylase domain-containing protein [Deltaproteobacteria bacterium]